MNTTVFWYLNLDMCSLNFMNIFIWGNCFLRSKEVSGRWEGGFVKRAGRDWAKIHCLWANLWTFSSYWSTSKEKGKEEEICTDMWEVWFIFSNGRTCSLSSDLSFPQGLWALVLILFLSDIFHQNLYHNN